MSPRAAWMTTFVVCFSAAISTYFSCWTYWIWMSRYEKTLKIALNAKHTTIRRDRGSLMLGIRCWTNIGRKNRNDRCMVQADDLLVRNGNERNKAFRKAPLEDGA